MGAFDDLDAQLGGSAPAAPTSAFADLDAQLGTPPSPGISKGESFGRGALQGASLGFGDEGAALADTVISHIPGVRTIVL